MRDISQEFLQAMRKGLDKGRRMGHVEWDQHWENCTFPCSPTQWMIMRLHQEVDELVIAVNENNPDNILREAADVSNFAMFIADLCN